MGLKRTIRSRPGSLFVCFRGETMTLALLLVPCSTTRVVLDLTAVTFLFFVVLLMKDYNRNGIAIFMCIEFRVFCVVMCNVVKRLRDDDICMEFYILCCYDILWYC